MDTKEANKKISKFIENCYLNGEKINVITGKGTGQNPDDPYQSSDLSILKHSIPEFIKNNSNDEKIIKIDLESVNSPAKKFRNLLKSQKNLKSYL